MLSSLCLCFCGNLLLPPSEQTEILQTWYQNTSFVPQKDRTYFIISRYWDIKWFIRDTCPWFWSTKSIFYRRQFQEILMFLRDPVIELGKLVSVHWRTVINGIFSMCWNILSLIWDSFSLSFSPLTKVSENRLPKLLFVSWHRESKCLLPVRFSRAKDDGHCSSPLHCVKGKLTILLHPRHKCRSFLFRPHVMKLLWL